MLFYWWLEHPVILITFSLGFSIYCESSADFYDQFLIGCLLGNVIRFSSGFPCLILDTFLTRLLCTISLRDNRKCFQQYFWISKSKDVVGCWLYFIILLLNRTILFCISLWAVGCSYMYALIEYAKLRSRMPLWLWELSTNSARQKNLAIIGRWLWSRIQTEK